MSAQTKKSFVQHLQERYDELYLHFAPVKSCVEREFKNLDKDTKEKFSKLKACVENLQWRIIHFEKDQVDVDEKVEESFEDLFQEIDWRLREVQMALKGENLCDEDEEIQLAKNLSKGKEE